MHTLFGTDGIRTKMGTSPLTPHELVDLGAALGMWMHAQKDAPRILIGHDTRYSAALIKASLQAGLLQYPVNLYDAQIIPTPALFHQVVYGPYDFGIMITASHNQYQDNGIKIITPSGKLSAEDEAELTALVTKGTKTRSYELLGTLQQAPKALLSYLTALKPLFPERFLEGITLVLDCAHGSYTAVAPDLLASYGAHVINLGTCPDGKNINKNCGSLHPEALRELVITSQAHAGFAFDGDGDRLVAVAHDGSIQDGDQLLAFLLKHPSYQQEKEIVGTIMSNEGLAVYLSDYQKQLYRTPVGDKYVVEKMKECGALLGGEPSGHLIARDFSATADGLFVLLKVAHTACLTGDWNFASFTKLPHVLLNVPVAAKKDLTQEPFASLIAAQQAQLAQGRIIVRYSGTEPLLRIMVEAPSSDQAYAVGSLLSQTLTHALTKEY